MTNFKSLCEVLGKELYPENETEYGKPKNGTMTPEKFKNEMQKISDQLDKNLCDEEITHSEADGLMCDLLRELGYGEGVDVFEDMPKWYA